MTLPPLKELLLCRDCWLTRYPGNEQAWETKQETGTVTCSDCGKEVSAWTLLLVPASAWDVLTNEDDDAGRQS